MRSGVIRTGFQWILIIAVTEQIQHQKEAGRTSGASGTDSTAKESAINDAVSDGGNVANIGNGTSEASGTDSSTKGSVTNDGNDGKTDGGTPETNETKDDNISKPSSQYDSAEFNGLRVSLTVLDQQDYPGIYIGSVVRLKFNAALGFIFTSRFSSQEFLTISLIASNDNTLAMSRIVKTTVGTHLILSDTHVKHWVPGFNDTKLGVAFESSVDFYLARDRNSFVYYDLEDWTMSIEYELVCVGLETSGIGEMVLSMAQIKIPFIRLQVQHEFQGVKSVDSKPSFHLVNPTAQIELFRSMAIGMTMVIPYPTSYVNVTVEASPLYQGSLNGDHHQKGDGPPSPTLPGDQYQGLLVQSIQGRSVGTAFNYSVFPEHLTASGYDTCPLKSTLSLVKGPLVNRESLLESPDHENSSYITMDITLLLTDPTMAAPAVSVVFGMQIGNLMLVQDVTLAVSQPNDDSGKSEYVSKTLEDLLTSEPPDNINVSSGQTSQVQFLLRTLRESNYTYSFNVSTTLANFTVANPYDNVLKLLSVTPVFFGNNLVCQSAITEKKNLPGVKYVWEYEIKINVFNMGIYTDSDSDLLKLNATMVVLGTAKKGDVFRMTTRLKEKPISKTFLVDGPPKASFELHSLADGPMAGGYPFFARIIIHTPPGSQMEYNVIMHISKSYLYDPSAYSHVILTVNSIESGSNLHNGFQESDIAVHHSSSINSDVHDIGTMSFFVKNSGENIDAGANDLTLEVVGFRPFPYYDGLIQHLDVDIDGIGVKRVWFRSLRSIEYQVSLLEVTIGSTCFTSEYYAGQLNVFEIHVQSIRKSTGGRLQILIPTSDGFSFENASVISKGKNVVCVNVGPVENTTLDDGSLDTIVLDIPLLCNRQRVDSEAEDKLVIGVTVRIGKVRQSLLGMRTDVNFTATLKTASPGEEKTVSQAFTIVSPYDMGELVNLLSLSQSDQWEFQSTISGTEDLRLQWSLDGEKFFTSTLSIHKHHGLQTNSIRVYPYYTPLLVRYFRVIRSTKGACHHPFIPTISHGIPVLHGPNTTGHLMNELAYVVNHRDRTCMVLAGPGSIVELPYLWAEFNTSMFGLGEPRPFTVYIDGYGLHCGEMIEPQVIMVVYPKQNPRLDDENQQHMCDYFETTEEFPSHPSYQSCRFICDCSGAEECARFTLLIMNTGTLEEISALCRVGILPPP